ncbi:MAG: hypothetical protein ABIT38_18725 [Gemmatimonadaceae bacterium]
MTYRSPDGTVWSVEVEMPTHSGALVVFKHPDNRSGRRDRYVTMNAKVPQANDPRARLDAAGVLSSLDERELARLFRRSVPVETVRPSYIVS